ncbi:MAG: UbiD family decarboxylase [Candidatus Binatia bacterium]|nr:UbiD family decarboxylase [Candidatus Binatia bacterium]
MPEQETGHRYRDLREWIEKVDRMGELKVILGAHWDLEMAGITEIIAREAKGVKPALLFDDIPGVGSGYRTLFEELESLQRLALILDLELDQPDMLSSVIACRDKLKRMEPIPPRFVENGEVLQNVDEGEKIDLFKFPLPRHHEKDGGRYFGARAIV